MGVGLMFLPRLAWTVILLFTLLAIARMTGMYHYAQHFSVEMGSCKFFCLGWPGTMILLISASCYLGMSGMSHFV
jgi:hypothetical protein